MTSDAEIQTALRRLRGKRCCRQRVGRGRSLSIGFGEKISPSKAGAAEPFYGEWELGTYRSAWRIIREGRVACGSLDVVDSIDELDALLQEISLGAVAEIASVSRFDIRVRLDNGIIIEFICASADDDEMFHIFGPDSLYLEYVCPDGWTIGKSNTPWN